MSQFEQAGDYLDYTPGSAVSAGAIILLTDTVVFAPRAIPANELGSVLVRGVISGVAKETGTAWTQGQLIYWDNGNSRFTHASSGNKKAGIAAAAAASGAATGSVLLMPNG